MNKSTSLRSFLGITGLLFASTAFAATSVITDGGGGTVPAAATDVFGSWDSIVSGNVIPLGALAIGLAATAAGVRAGSGGLIGGGIIGILSAILVTALPAIVTETAGGAGFITVSNSSAAYTTILPMIVALYGSIRYVRAST